MNNNDDDRPDPKERVAPSPTDSTWSSSDEQYEEFDDEALEESDRDADYAPTYIEDEDEPEYFVDPPESAQDFEDDEEWDGDDLNDDDDNSSDDAYEAATHTPEASEEWQESADSYPDEQLDSAPLPLGLIIIAVVALALLVAGGYGVMQQRAEAQEEIRSLQAQLATSASPQDVAATRNSMAEMRSSSRAVQSEVEALKRENSSLEAIIRGLENQLQAQQSASSNVDAVTPTTQVAKPVASTTPKPASATPTSPTENTNSANAGAWFVNFGSYGEQQRAESWARRLQPGYGNVIVAAGKKDGRIFYRVRVIGLASRDAAESTARKLEKEHKLSKLWVGKN